MKIDQTKYYRFYQLFHVVQPSFAFILTFTDKNDENELTTLYHSPLAISLGRMDAFMWRTEFRKSE